MIELLLGHIAGDYLLQNDKMAKSKSKRGFEGTYWCTFHCVIYSACIAAFMIHGYGWRAAKFDNRVSSWGIAWLIAFLSHYWIDRGSMGRLWMRLYRQTTEGPFAALIYIGVDNGIHLILMYIFFKWLGAR